MMKRDDPGSAYRSGEPGSTNRGALVAAALTVVLWASAFAAIRAGLASYSPESIALLRYVIASFVLALYAARRKMPLPNLRDVPALAALGFLGFTLYNVALNAGELNVSAGTASFIVASVPVHMAILATLFFGERLRPMGWFGIFLGLAGVGVTSFTGNNGFEINSSSLLVLLAAVVQAVYSVGQRSFLRTYGALAFVTYAIWFGTLFLLVFAPGLIQDMRSARTGATLAIIYMGLFPGAIAYVSWSYVLSHLAVSVAGSLLYLVPGFAVLIAWLWLGEAPGMIAFVGGTLILSGVIIVHRLGKERPSADTDQAENLA